MKVTFTHEVKEERTLPQHVVTQIATKAIRNKIRVSDEAVLEDGVIRDLEAPFGLPHTRVATDSEISAFATIDLLSN